MYKLELQCHPSTPSAAVERIDVSFTGMSGSTLTICYAATGTLARLRVPQPCVSRRADALWRHTCCELFIAATDATAYSEFNFSPSSEWAAYEFDSYRQGMRPLSLPHPPRITVTSSESQWSMNASVECDVVPAGAMLAFCVVTEEADGRLSYWALAHPPGKPDFHHADGFAFRLPV